MGIAGLRALLKARIAQAHHKNWLIFGERNAAHDWLWGSEIESWQEQGHFCHVDAIFSRDQTPRRYVQDHLLAGAPLLQHSGWPMAPPFMFAAACKAWQAAWIKRYAIFLAMNGYSPYEKPADTGEMCIKDTCY